MGRFYGGRAVDVSDPATWRDEVAKTANYTVLGSDNGKLFTTTGAGAAVTFTLPAVKSGYCYGFLNAADQNMTVASAEGDNIVTVNDLSADSVAFSTSSEKIGAFVKLYTNSAGTKWLVEKMCSNAMTISS